MKSESTISVNQKIWVVLAILVFVTLSITIGSVPSQSQQNIAKPTASGTPDFSKYPVAELNAPTITNPAEKALREIKGKRYDTRPMIMGSPGPNDTMILIWDAEIEPPAVPADQSKLIVLGSFIDSKGFVSNNRSSIYSEYSLRIQKLLKNESTNARDIGDVITVDRPGGILRYPTGQQILYRYNWLDLPELNTQYIVFLDKDGDEQNPNYRVITAYRLKDGHIFPLDHGKDFDELTGLDEKTFVNRINIQMK